MNHLETIAENFVLLHVQTNVRELQQFELLKIFHKIIMYEHEGILMRQSVTIIIVYYCYVICIPLYNNIVFLFM